MTKEAGSYKGTSMGKSNSLNSDRHEPIVYFESASLITTLCTYLHLLLLILLGYLADFLRRFKLKEDRIHVRKEENDWFKMNVGNDAFFTRNIYRRLRDCFDRPIASTPGAYLDVMDRVSDDYNWTIKETGTITRCLNLGSYNYLGFADNSGPCAEASMEATHKYGAGVCSVRGDLGTLDIHKELESLVAEFMGKPAALCFGMGFASNSTNIPALVGKGDLIVSDELNHTSLILGSRVSGANIRPFKHNDMESLEKVLRKSILEGQPRTHRPWGKILILVEGVFSMEGTAAKLHELIRLKKKYKVYLYIDEAHSIGAIGERGRGLVEYLGCDPADVDVLMGTFTKSFGACGGYIAAEHNVISHLRKYSHGSVYGAPLAGPVAQQIITSMSIIMGKDGTDEGKKRVAQLLENSRYFRKRLHEMKFIVYGMEDSPVVPVLIYYPSKLAEFSRQLLKRKIAVVVVGSPATPVAECRARLCMSSSHTKEMLDYALKEISEVGDNLFMKLSQLKH